MFHVCKYSEWCYRKDQIQGHPYLPYKRRNCWSNGKILSGGYSSVHTRLDFDTEMFTPKSEKYMKEKDWILEDIKSVIGNPDEKVKTKKLNKELHELFIKEDLNSTNKPIYSITLDGESESHKRGFFSKNFNLDENNQYEAAMTKPLPIGIFKQEKEVSMDILNNSISNFDLNSKIGEIFVVDIEFDTYDDPRKKMYNEVFPCIFEPKSKVFVNSRSVHQLLFTMRIGKRGDVLKFKVTEKTQATLLPKKRFPMFIDHMHFLTTRAGWKITNVHQYYNFEQGPFKKEYILGNQRSRQAAVARGDSVQANFWKLLNDANFGFNCRDNSQNKSLYLIYDERQEVDFISKYNTYSFGNCFLHLDSQIENIDRYYDKAENFDENERPFVETLREEEIESVKKRHLNKK